MKTKNKLQTQHYLLEKGYVSELDFEMIKSYCSQNLKLNISDNTQKHPEYVRISCPDFMQWVIGDLEAGDVVKWNGNLGILDNVDPTNARICPISDRNVPKNDFISVPIQDIQLADESDSEAVYELLSRNGLEYNRMRFMITEKYIPGPGDIVSFSGVGKKGFGVVRGILDGEVEMYCYCDGNDRVFYNLHERLGNLSDLQFSRIGTDEYGRKKLEELLNAEGKSWNHPRKRIDAVGYRVKPGNAYWYLSDKLTMERGIDDGKPGTAATKRYLAGNYRRTMEEILEYAEQVTELNNKYFAEPGR